MLVRLLTQLSYINIKILKNIMIESTCNYENLGKYINSIRIDLGISIKQLCDDCHISRRTYYESSEW